MKRFSTLLLLVFFYSAAQADVWVSRNQWNDQWESRFSRWMETSFKGDIYTRGKYAGTRQDCADAVYFARLIFAYENKLPFVIDDPQDRGSGTISNSTDQFNHLSEKRRLRSFMNYVGGMVSTVTLMRDTYPIKLNRKWFKPGVVAALPRHYSDGSEQPGHGQIVTRVEKNGVIHYLKSTVPAKVHTLKHTTLNSFVPAPRKGSFRYWKQPKHYGRRESSLPGYGTEQYRLGGVFADELQKKVALVDETRDQKLSRLAGEVCTQVKERVPIVDEAWAFKKKIGSRCMNYDEFDSYSTPSRDGKIKKALKYLLLTGTGNEDGEVKTVAKYLNKACGSIEYLPGKKITAAKFSQRLMAGKVSSDPNQPPGVRWGDIEPKRQGCKQFY